MSNTIIIFTLDGCDHCLTLKSKLKEINIPFQEIEINQNRNIWDQVVSQTGFNYLPTVFIKNDIDDHGPVFVPGRDYETQEEIIDIIKSYQ